MRSSRIYVFTGYVLFGLSGGAKGDGYIAPHSVLSKINPGSCPERDLFDDLATAFQAAGYKVLCYMATEGPGKRYMMCSIAHVLFYTGWI